MSSSSLVVSGSPAGPPVVLTYNQNLVLGCSVASSGVVNVISWTVAVSVVSVVKVYKAVSLGTPALSARMETCGVETEIPSFLISNWILVRW